MLNSFDKMFDRNHDGRLDWMERANQMSFLDMAMGFDNTDDDDDFDMDDDDDLDIDDDDSFDLDDDDYDEW